MSKEEFKNIGSAYDDFVNKFAGDDWTIADLSEGKNRDGFPWGKLGSNEHTQRHPKELVWIMKNKKKGLLSKLFGK